MLDTEDRGPIVASAGHKEVCGLAQLGKYEK
jgi:hypothetical protein